MKQFFLTIIFFFVAYVLTFAQCTIRGKITDQNGETIIGASVVLKSNWSVGSVTDIDGNYSLKIPDTTSQTLVVSSIGFKHIEEFVRCSKGGVIIENFILQPDAKEIGEVQIVGKAIHSKETYVEKIKQNSAVTLDYISSETMKKTGDVNVSAAVARVTGVSTTSAGMITVRGIGDRYVKTSINGSIIPTLDPFTNNLKLDMFPASLVDNVLITKTASADLPGDWAGAYLSVVTKDYPEELAVNVETSFGYNDQTSFKEVLTSERSSTDWLGYDDGLRSHDHSTFVRANMNPDQYTQLVAIGLGDYYKSMDVTGWLDNSPIGNDYFKLGLIQLGLLAPGQFNDNTAFQNAKDAYDRGPYPSQAFQTINAGVPATGKSFADNWNTTTRVAPINFSQSFSIGNQRELFGKTFGFLFGFRYGSSIVYDPNSTANRAGVASDTAGNQVNTIYSTVSQQVSRETDGWSALLNVACKFNPNHSLSLLFMPNLTGVNSVRNSLDNAVPENFVYTRTQFFEQRRQLVYQMKLEDYFPSSKIKLETNASYTNGNSTAPDFKNLQYFEDPILNTFQIGGTIGDGVHRYYRYLNDDILDARMSADMPLKGGFGNSNKLKLGGAYLWNEKKSDQYDYSVNFGPNAPHLENSDLNAFFSLDNFDFRDVIVNGNSQTTINQYYSEDGSAANHTFGSSKIAAGFILADYSFNPSIRFSGGLRVEKADIYTDVFRFDSLGYLPNDIRRDYKNGYPSANPGQVNETSFLPSANLIYKLNGTSSQEDTPPKNIRLNFSQTVARPSIRELSDVAVYDFEYRTAVYGNSDLKMVHVNNYDIRYESYFKSGDNYSVSAFYKNFKDHIELVSSGGYTWQNVDRSHVSGIELEGKKTITRQLEFRANLTLADSRTEYVRTRYEISNGIKTYIPLDTVSRAMFGQAPYVVNGILNYHADSLGLILTFSYNVQGPRLVIASDVKEIPDVYELQRHLIDIKAVKTLGKHFSVSLTVRDILNSPVRRAYKYPEGYTLDYDKYTLGTNYTLGILYKL